MMDQMEADILIIGAGGAGLLAALHALEISGKLKIVIAVVIGALGGIAGVNFRRRVARN